MTKMISLRGFLTTAPLALAIALGFSAACTKGKGAGNGSGGGRGRGERGPAVVRVKIATQELIARPVSVVAILQGRQQADVYSKVVGRIAARGPGEGESVSRGQVLFRVDRSDPGESFLNTPVESPISGWVGQWHIGNLGEQVSTNEAVVTVVDDLVLKTTVFLPAADWLDVDQNTKVMVKVGGEERQAQIATIARAGEAASGRGGITLLIPNGKRDWRSGLSARVTFSLTAAQRILIAASALTITDQGAYVYTVEEGKAKRIPVTFSIFDSDTVEITNGLKSGSSVIVAGSNLIADGSAVTIANEDAKASL